MGLFGGNENDLQIAGATHGFDTTGVEDYLKKIRTDLIQELKDKMDSNFNNIRDGVHKAWVGKSADTFIRNMKDQKEIVKTALEEAFQAVIAVVVHASTNMNNLDQTLVARRKDGGN